MTYLTPGARLKQALAQEHPLQIMGTINAYTAIMATHTGYKAIYLSGAGVANASYGLPDLGMTSLDNVLIDIQRICGATDLPLLVDADTGWGNSFNIARTVKEISRAGAAGIHIEDQVQAKRCGHRPGKAIVSQQEMVDRITAAVDARNSGIDKEFVIMARTDALAVEGMTSAIERAQACIEAGADMIFPEAITTLAQYQQFSQAIQAPILANITEFGATPLFSTQELSTAGVAMVLYPLSAFRAMNAAALMVYQTTREQGSQKEVLKDMQSREELYQFLGYHDYEEKLDHLFHQGKSL